MVVFETTVQTLFKLHAHACGKNIYSILKYSIAMHEYKDMLMKEIIAAGIFCMMHSGINLH